MRRLIHYIRQSLSTKLSLGIVLMAVPIFLLALGILFVESRENVKKEATEHATSVLNITMQRMNRYMGAVETATDINDWEITENLDPDSLMSYSRFVVAMNSHVDGCSISMEPNVFPQFGRYFSVYTVREPDTICTVIEEKYEYFEKAWYKQPHLIGKPCWVVYFDETDSLTLTIDGMLASYSKPIYNAEKHFIGVISTDLSLKHLSKIITQESPYPGSYFMMTGDEGRYIIHPDTTLLFHQTVFGEADPRRNSDLIALGHEMTTGKQGYMKVMIDGEPCLVCYQPMPRTNWSLALVCPDKSILQSYYRLTYIITAIIIVGLLLILVFCSTTVTNAVKPLNKLSRKIQRIAEGHYDEQIKRSRYEDAVGRLQNSFATMQKSLNSHVSNIHQINEETARRNEELKHATELAKEGDKQKTQFIQDVSHQVRTPLNIIMGFAQVLRESKSVMPPEEVKSITDMMSHNARLLDRMSSMLFDSSVRGTTEEIYANKDEEVSCNEVARDCIRFTFEHFPTLRLSFSTDLPDDFYIQTSYNYLMRSIRELLYNAARYSDGLYVALKVSERESMVRFIIEDTGTGIPEEYIPRLFQPFTKVNDLSEGLGLGLQLTKRHITNLGGELYLDTNYRAGCRFIIELPKVRA